MYFLPGSQKDPPIRARNKPHDDLHREPGIANTLHIEEGLMSIGLILVQSPSQGVVCGPHRDILNERHPHVRMRFQAEGNDRHHDEEHGNHANHLKTRKF